MLQPSLQFSENIPDLAAVAYRLADDLCESCTDFHALWPYRRAARAAYCHGARSIMLDQRAATAHPRIGS